MTKSVTVQMTEILDEYSEEVQDVTNAAIKKVAKECVRQLKNMSPKRPGGSSYARGWTATNTGKHGLISALTVHNRTDYQLTHLLENGHVVRNKKGTYGRAPAIKHIEPAEKWADNELTSEIERGLR